MLYNIWERKSLIADNFNLIIYINHIGIPPLIIFCIIMRNRKKILILVELDILQTLKNYYCM
jgi:hypothetical protein